MSKVTTVSRKSVSRSILYDSELPGETTTRARRAASSWPSSWSKSHARFCLEAVRELGHRALQMRHLLVEIGTQPRQFVGVAEFCRGDDLVMLFGEADVVEIGNVGRQAVGTHGQHPFVAFAAHLGLAVGFHFLRVGVTVAIVGLIARHLGARVDLAFAAAAVLAFLFFLALFGFGLVFLAGVFGAFFHRLVAIDEVEVAERHLRGLGEGRLIVDQHRERFEVAAGFLGDPLAHQRQAGFGALRRLLAGQRLADQQFERARDRHIFLRLRAADRVAAHPHRERGREILAHPRHVARAERLDPRALHRVERRCGKGFGRTRGTVDLVAVVLHPQRIAVGEAARLGDLIAGQGARRGRHLDRLADLHRRVGGESDLDLGIAGHRARHARQCGFQVVEGRLGCHITSNLASFCDGRKRGRRTARLNPLRRRACGCTPHCRPAWDRRGREQGERHARGASRHAAAVPACRQ